MPTPIAEGDPDDLAQAVGDAAATDLAAEYPTTGNLTTEQARRAADASHEARRGRKKS